MISVNVEDASNYIEDGDARESYDNELTYYDYEIDRGRDYSNKL